MNFINFDEEISKIRVRLGNAIDGIFIENGNVDVIECEDESLMVSLSEGNTNVISVQFDENIKSTVVVTKDENNSTTDIHDVMDLSTDDMVAIYEFVWYELKEKK